MINFKNFYKRVNFDIDYYAEERFLVKQNDTKSRGFYVKIIQDGRVVKPSASEKLTFYGRKPDGTDIFQDGVLDGGEFRIDLPNQAFTAPGEMKSEFSLRGPNGELISTKDFTITVIESFPTDPIESTDDFSALQSALAQVAGFAGDIQDVQIFAENIQDKIGDLDGLTTDEKTSVVNSINELNDKINNVLSSEDLTTLLNAKVDKETLGDLSLLKTEEKTILVNTINELFDDINEIREVSDVSTLLPLLNSKADKSTVGNLVDLVDFQDETAQIDNLVDAVNYVFNTMKDSFENLGDINLEGLALSEDLGDKTTLTTTDKTNLVNAINEINAALKTVESVTDVEQLSLLLSGKADKSSLGNLSELNTTQKNNLVAAINEVNAQIGDVDFSEIYTLLEGKVSQEDFDTAVTALQSNIDTIELTPGPQGPPGQDGQPGQPGADGADGQDGYTPVKGVDYFDGEDGQDGKSAYQIWLDEGNTGTEQDFLASLEGPPGPPGEGSGGGLTLEDLPNRGSISHVSDTDFVTNVHMRQVNASEDSMASGDRSQVNASEMSIASGPASQVNVSAESNAIGYKSQVNASVSSIASGPASQVNVSIRSEASGIMSQVNASESSTASEYTSQVNASMDSTAKGERSQINASNYSEASGFMSQVNASSGAKASGVMSQVNVSSGVENNTDYSSAWGLNPGDPSTQNIKIHLLSESGDINHSGVLNTGHNFTDFAELFPNLTGEAQGYGLIQTIDGHGVRPANSGDQVVGVTSATAGVVLGETSFSWAERWLKDEWGAFIYHDIPNPDWEPKEGQTEEDRPTITVPKENPEYDPEREYAKRQERPDEWTVVGLVGQVYVRLDENVQPMDYVKSLNNGVGQTSLEPTNIRVMKITQDFDEDKGYKIGFCLLK